MRAQVAPSRRHPKQVITNMERLTIDISYEPSSQAPASPADRGYVPKENSKIIVMETDGAGLRRVRMSRTSQVPGAVMGEPLRVVTTNYLDGHSRKVSSTRDYVQEEMVPFDAVPMRTSDVTDFGRLSMAAKSLAQSMIKFGPQNEPSPEQLAVFVAGYRNLVEWHRKVGGLMTRAQGEIDLLETLLSRSL